MLDREYRRPVVTEGSREAGGLYGLRMARDLHRTVAVVSHRDDAGASAGRQQRELNGRAAVKADARARNLLSDGPLSPHIPP